MEFMVISSHCYKEGDTASSEWVLNLQIKTQVKKQKQAIDAKKDQIFKQQNIHGAMNVLWKLSKMLALAGNLKTIKNKTLTVEFT